MKTRFFSSVIILLLILVSAAAADIKIKTSPKKPSSSPDMNLIDPIKNMLSGRAWLIAEGIDPGLRRRPGWDTLTRMDWQKLEQSFGTSGAESIAPAMQAAGGGALVPFRNPAPAFSRDVLISRDFSSSPMQTEPHIAVNPNDPDHLIVGMIDYNFPSISAYVSLDGGAVWEGPFQGGYLPDDRVSGGDPVVAFDREGNTYMTSISIGVEEFSIGPLYTSSTVSSIAVSKSTDGGFSWPDIISTARSGVNLSEQQVDPSGRLRGSVSIGFLDKPWITVGIDPEDETKDIVYLTYVEFEVFYQILYMGELPTLAPTEMSSTIKLVKSADQGITWSDPVDVAPTVRRVFGEVDAPTDVPGVLGTDRTVQGPRPVVGSDGTVYVAWLDSTDDGSMKGLGEMNVARSEDGGETFSNPVIASVFNEVPFRPRNAFFRYWASSFPNFAIGPNDELYLSYVGRPVENARDDGDVYFLSSEDRGESWTRPVRVNDDEGLSLQFFPAMTVDPEGKIHLMWADMRDDPTQIRYHIYYSSSGDGGKTWGFELEELGYRVNDTRVTDFHSNPNRGFPYGLFIGDYFGIAASSEDVYMVWPDTRLAEFGGINQKIGFARQRALRQPDIFVSPQAGPGGESITIQGFDFQPDMNVFIQLSDATIATARTNSEGRFTAGVYIPVTGEGSQNLRVFDESGNLASTSFYTEFGFGNIEKLYGDLMEKMLEIQEDLGEMKDREWMQNIY
jgi:hypothetical protein